MALRVAINGFGRIGRNVLRAIAESGRKDIEVVGINLPHILYCDMLGLPIPPAKPYRAGIRWIHEERDIKTVMLYFLPEKRLTIPSWLKSYRGKRVYAYAAWDDPGPFLASAQRIVGHRAHDVADLVKADFRGTSTCSHLNDLLRSTSAVTALAAELPVD